MTEKKLERVHIERSRLMEYLNENDLRAMTGLSPSDFHKAIIKELVDNALDACEERGVTPEIKVLANRENGQYHYKVSDNGGGMTEEVIRKILNFETRTSSKEAYRAPTRGAQGNALKTVFGIPVALRLTNTPRPVMFRTQDKEYTITIDPNYIADVPEISFEVSNSQPFLDGTEISLAIDLDLDSEDYRRHYEGIYHDMLFAYSLFNPQANFSFNGMSFPARNLEFKKFLPTDLTSPQWYTAKDFASLIYGLVNAGYDKGIRDFLSDFKNASSKTKQTEILSVFNGIYNLSDLIQRKELIPELLRRMQTSITPQKQTVLGLLGEDVFKTGIGARYSFEHFYYRKAENTFKIDEAEVPYILEMAVATGCERNNESTHLTVFVGINNSISYGNPFFTNEYFRYSTQRLSLQGWGLNGFLSQLKVDSYDPVVIVIHLVCPRLEYKDKSKTQINIQPFLSDLSKLAYLTCKKWFEYKKALERASVQRESRENRRQPEKISLRDAVFEVLPKASEIVSSGGKYPFSARNLYYQVRPLLQQLGGEIDELRYEYFTPPLLTEYQEQYGKLEGLYYDPRGVLIEPHSGKEIPLGTQDVDAYNIPEWEFNKLLYIEKKGFVPILQQAQIPQCYDLAIMAAEGYATRAAKLVLNSAHKETEFSILALHDFDADGMMIKSTLERETRTSKNHRIKVIELGLRLSEALEMNLECEKVTRKKALQKKLYRTLNDDELDFLQGIEDLVWKDGKQKRIWHAQRIELNAMTPEQFIEYIERKLQEHELKSKVLPDAEIVNARFRRDIRDKLSSSLKSYYEQMLDLDSLIELAINEIYKRFKGGRVRYHHILEKKLSSNPPESWREIIEREAVKVASKLKHHNADMIKTLALEELTGRF
ncbi:MAG: ATP-binding protein [Candidatus Poribacteria bacterium]